MYNELFEVWKWEKENAEVQVLPKDFFDRLSQYVKRLREEGRMLDEKSTRARLLLQESKNVKKLGGELIRLRFEKVVRKVMAGESIAKEDLTVEEERLYGGMVSSLESYQSFLKDVLSGRSSRVEVEVAKKRVLRFLQEIPAIIGADLKPYGPFKPEDVASVPAKNARILVKQGLAVEVEVKA